MLAQQGDKLPVSAFTPDGIFPVATTQYEKRGVAINVPEWIMDNCIQCNQCAMVCPHAAIRPVLLTDEEELAAAPAGFEAKKALGKEAQGVSLPDAGQHPGLHGLRQLRGHLPGQEAGPGHEAAGHPAGRAGAQPAVFSSLPVRDDLVKRATVKGSQFCQPLLEFSGACAGCGETPYAKLLTQLFGERMVIGNATGCSLHLGRQRAGDSLLRQQGRVRSHLGQLPVRGPGGVHLRHVPGHPCSSAQLVDWPKRPWQRTSRRGKRPSGLAGQHEGPEESKEIRRPAQSALPTTRQCAAGGNPWESRLFTKKSYWVFLGDGAAYDIAYGGLDHVLASGEDINIMVYDTEVYSNTGGQSSKATPTGSMWPSLPPPARRPPKRTWAAWP
jgi:pyruvate-ferredoxin/flavodoxin oxidoreductase